MKIPLASIVMPCYNASKTLPNAINSVLSQTENNIELVIVDDGSMDGSQEVINRFRADKRIKYYFRQHEGIVASRNFGVDHARASIILTQDADDMSMPDRVEKCLDLMMKKKADVVYHGLYVNAYSGMYRCMERHYTKAEELSIPRLLKEQYIPGVPCFKREVWEKRKFRSETQYCYDWMMYLDWVLSGFKVVPLDQGLYEYVRYLGSSSHRYEQEGKRTQSIKRIEDIVRLSYGKTMDASAQYGRLVESYGYTKPTPIQ